MTRGALRRLWFQVHKWIGLALMILLIPLGLTGSVLLANDALADKPAEARRSTTPPPALPLPLSRYLDAARGALPRSVRLSQLSLPQAAGESVTARGFVPGKGPQSIALDPATAAPQGRGGGGGGVMAIMHRFHGSLLVPGVGRTLVGWLGIAMLISSLSGLWLWWPAGRWLRGLRWGRTPDVDANLHHVVGFWIALPLAALSLSGAWISFPTVAAALVGEKALRRGGGGGGGGGSDEPPHMTIDAAAQRLGDGMALRDVALPSGGRAIWTATRIDGTRVALDDETGAFVDPPRREGGGPVMRFMRSIHEGAESTGPVWRVIVFLGGLAPAVLGVTGILMWLRTRRWRGDVARRQRERTAVG